MYFIIEKTILHDVRIVGNFKDMTLKFVQLGNYLKENEVTLVHSHDEITVSGKYCVEVSPIKYEIVDATVSMDGYIFYGRKHFVPLRTLDIINYKITSNKKKGVCKELLAK